MVLHHQIQWRGGGPPWSVDVPRAGPVACTVGVVSVAREPLSRGRHCRACIRTRGAAIWASGQRLCPQCTGPGI